MDATEKRLAVCKYRVTCPGVRVTVVYDFVRQVAIVHPPFFLLIL